MPDIGCLPAVLESGVWAAGHVQGIALDLERGWVYYSFTNMLVKRGLDGRLLGTVRGLVGHLGCLAIDRRDGRVYASLEYKRDSIGQGIRERLGEAGPPPEDGFYIAVFDGQRITRANMDAEQDDVMRAVHLPEVLADYKATVPAGGGAAVPHRYGCSGIDGLSFGPPFGRPRQAHRLHVAYGIYGDVQRSDNDNQVILCYDTAAWDTYAAPLTQRAPHRSGPPQPEAKYFVFTGNTTYGIQNLEYDPFTGHWLCAVYPGAKPQYPNNSLYIIDGAAPPQARALEGVPGGHGLVLGLWQQGIAHPSGVYSWQMEHGATGLFSLGDGRFYISHAGQSAQGQFSRVHLYRWTGAVPCPFELAAPEA